MPKKKGFVKAVIGCQFGDEGKGKIVDFFAQDAHIVVRYSGGSNAGHTVENEMGDFKARIVPCGMFSPATQLNIIGSGVVWQTGNLVKELRTLEEKGVDFSSLRIDSASHLVMPWHILEDRLDEKRRGGQAIGTTGNGIGPAYSDKCRRIGFRAGDFLDFPEFKERFHQMWQQKLQLAREHWELCSVCDFCSPMLNEGASLALIEGNLQYLARKFGSLDKLICDTPPTLWKAMDEGQNILLEGAQGALLDIDHGTYPYVTSSNTGATSAAEGSGIAPRDITEVIGVAKAYMSRVGNGPFPTRAGPEEEEKLRRLGNEYGTVTGRPRNCGWFDMASFKRVARINGLTGLAITRLDILDDFPRIKARLDYGYHMIFTGWGPEKSVKGCQTWRSLPKRAREYCREIACGVPVKIVSIGPRREETIVVNHRK